jgi:DNA polymerase delta subunit 2
MASGLSMGAQEAPADLKAEIMVEWLTGEAGGLEVCLSLNDKADKQDQLEGGRIARLILAGNTLTMPIKGEDDHKPVSYRIHDVCAADNSETI